MFDSSSSASFDSDDDIGSYDYEPCPCDSRYPRAPNLNFKDYSSAESLESHPEEEERPDPSVKYRRNENFMKFRRATLADVIMEEWIRYAQELDGGSRLARPESYTVPTRQVLRIEDMSKWENSCAYQEYVGFVMAMNEAVRGKSCLGTYHQSTTVKVLLDHIKLLSGWIDGIPPIQQPQRFGNKAFRTWYDKLSKDSHEFFLSHLPTEYHLGIAECHAYVLESFGNSTRIDYGTGHEMSYCMFLCSFFKIGLLRDEDKQAVVLNVFADYLNLVRKLQTVYKMEPAGSRGVWALDDFQFLPFIWGSAQLIDNPNISPNAFTKNDVIIQFHEHYMFIGCIKYIMENKVGPFAEHSNQLWNISAVPTWEKVNSGLIRMYKAEVLAKFPVIQHVLFGSLFPITLHTDRQPIYEGFHRPGLGSPPPPPPPASQQVPKRPT